MLLTVFVGLVIITAVSSQCTFEGSTVWHHYAGHCYFVSGSHDKRNYDEASLRCQLLDSELLSVTSHPEDAFVVDDLIPCRDCNEDDQKYYQIFWLGLRKFSLEGRRSSLNRRRADWSWHSGEAYNWQNWFERDSSQNLTPEQNLRSGYAGLYSDGLWTDLAWYWKYRYICERADIRTVTGKTGAMFNVTSLGGSTETTSFPVSITTTNASEQVGHNTSIGLTFTTPSPMNTRKRRLPTTQQTSQESPVNTETSSYYGGKGLTLDNNKYLYIGVVLGVVLVAVVACVAFLLIWRRRTSKSQSAPELPNITRQGHNDGIDNGAAAREDNHYVELGGVSSSLHSLPHSSPSDGSNMHPEVDRAEIMLPPPDRPGADGDSSVLYAVPHRRRQDNDDDDEGVTIVENTAYSSY